MKPPTMKRTLLLLLSALTAILLSAQSLTWEWRGLSMDPCSNWINCDTGCTACAEAASTSPQLFGTGAAFIGPQPCPHPIDTAANQALFTYGWPVLPDSANRILLSALAVGGGLQIDTIEITTWRDDDGPGYMRILGNGDELAGFVPIPNNWHTVLIENVGCMPVPEGGIFGIFQLSIQPIGGGLGAFALDRIRIVVSPCLSTGIGAVKPEAMKVSSIAFDTLGRQVGPCYQPGAYTTRDGIRRIVVLP